MVEVRARIDAMMPMTAARLVTLVGDDHIYVLAFLKTYEQFEETLGRTLKTIAMILQFGKFERLSPRDVAQRAVSLGILSDGRDWADAVRVRNELAHEYPLDPEKQAGQVNAAWDTCATLFATADAIRDFVNRERLLYGDL
ncbi:hypothetical protein [Sphingomonas sp. Leaf412]|uniref:hypothetical protein n=1 Tax=Sphingomonas sp. Leaf412 TaxID=1736370 RepID=UPI001F2D2808|nr:hypothetical protein [Sphingomonas sp. Leaf412]